MLATTPYRMYYERLYVLSMVLQPATRLLLPHCAPSGNTCSVMLHPPACESHDDGMTSTQRTQPPCCKPRNARGAPSAKRSTASRRKGG